MTIPKPPFESERRGELRRTIDRAADDLQKTYYSCLEQMADGVLLLNSETQIIYSTPQVEQVLKRHDALFATSPKFILHHPQHASRFAALVKGEYQKTGPFSLLLEGENGHDPLLLNFFQLPKSDKPNLQAARFMITLRDPNHYPAQLWQLFNKQFNLTPAEARLCLTLKNGLTLNDHCEKWKVSITTVRSQLRSIFDKTSTRRQSDLLRLIFLFTRS